MRARRILLTLLTLLTVLWAEQDPCAKTRLAIQPLGPFDRATLEEVSVSLRKTYDFEVDVLRPIPLPEEAYYPPRQRYRAGKILNFVDRTVPPRYDKILAITVRDISTTKDDCPDWGIFGLAYMSARPSVVSTYRLKKGASAAQLLVRLLKVVRHEVGHTIGLPHCPSDGCVMQDAKGSIKGIDSSDGSFCQTCVALAGPFLLKNDPIGKGP